MDQLMYANFDSKDYAIMGIEAEDIPVFLAHFNSGKGLRVSTPPGMPSTPAKEQTTAELLKDTNLEFNFENESPDAEAYMTAPEDNEKTTLGYIVGETKNENIHESLLRDAIVNTADQLHAIDNAIEKAELEMHASPEKAFIQENEKNLPNDKVPIEGFANEV